MKVLTLDCNYVAPEFASAFLIIHESTGVLVETNTSLAVPSLIQQIESTGLRLNQIKGVIVTHAHLDHAGGAGKILELLPEARLYAHPKAARHLIDPSRLLRSATQVYGHEAFHSLYGEIVPIPAHRVEILNPTQTLKIEQIELHTEFVLGHASHHILIFEPVTQTLFTGDSFGVSYPILNRKHPSFALISSSPTDYDGEAARQAYERILAIQPKTLALTHFGQFDGYLTQTFANQLRAQSELSDRIVKEFQYQIKIKGLSETQAFETYFDQMILLLRNFGLNFDRAELDLLALDLKINAKGLLYRAQKLSASA